MLRKNEWQPGVLGADNDGVSCNPLSPRCVKLGLMGYCVLKMLDIDEGLTNYATETGRVFTTVTELEKTEGWAGVCLFLRLLE